MPPESETSFGAQTDSIEEPYVAWEGFPFAWLEKRSQTRAQYFLTLGMTVVAVAAGVLTFIFIIVSAAERGEWGAAANGVCLLTFLLVFCVLVIGFSWLVGRAGAHREQKKREGV